MEPSGLGHPSRARAGHYRKIEAEAAPTPWKRQRAGSSCPAPDRAVIGAAPPPQERDPPGPARRRQDVRRPAARLRPRRGRRPGAGRHGAVPPVVLRTRTSSRASGRRARRVRRRDGVFYEFCRPGRATTRGDTYVFIIDEINRGNLSKIFGELMMLIEADKRGRGLRHPADLLEARRTSGSRARRTSTCIGMMNTADRSLAMVDYALRRRFAFARSFRAITMEVISLENSGWRADW